MRFILPRQVIVALLVATSTLAGQWTSTVVWSGTMRFHDESSRLQYRIPSGAGLRAFEIDVTSPSTNKETISATDVEFIGTSVRFRATFRNGATCTLGAVPANGYAGKCALASGDSADLTLVPPAASMLLTDHEILIARDAAPLPIRSAASVFVLGPAGYTEAVRGTNGFTCFIERPTKNDAWPMCYNREARETLLPVEQYRMRLRDTGVSDAAITDSVLRGYRNGRFRAPPAGALAYMLSRSAWTADPEAGTLAYLAPHVHIYAPNATNARVGVDTAQRLVVPMRVEREGRPDASIIVAVKLIEPATARP